MRLTYKTPLEALEPRRLLASSMGNDWTSIASTASPTVNASTAAVTASRRVFLIGNSLTDGLSYAGMQTLLASDGTSVSYGRQTGSGYSQGQNYYLQAPLVLGGSDPARPGVINPWGTYNAAFENQWDILTLQPHERRHLVDVQPTTSGPRDEGEVPMTMNFMRLLAQNSPDAQVYLYSRPARRTDITADLQPTGLPFDYSAEWMRDYVDSGTLANSAFYSRSAMVQLMPLMRNAQQADPIVQSMPPIRLIPAGEAYYNIDQLIKSGAFAGTSVTSMLNLYTDQSHPTQDLAAYVLALTFYSVLTGADARGAPVPAAYLTGARHLADPAVLSLVQQAVYDAVHTSAYGNWVLPAPAENPQTGSIGVRTFNDQNSNGVADAGEPPLSGVLVYLDQNNDSVRNPQEPTATSNALGVATFNGITPGTVRVRAQLPAGFSESAISSVLINVVAGSHRTASIGFVATQLPPGPGVPAGTSTLSGYVVKDNNSDGKWSSGEAGLAGQTVWIDVNNNGQIDTNEPTRTTASNGKYIFASIAAGTYYVRQVLPAGWSQTFPAANAAFKVVVATGATRAGNDFCAIGTTNPPPPPPPTLTASIAGRLFWDANRNGLAEAGEVAQAAKTVFIDANGNNLLDAAEVKTTTDSTGAFKFSGLNAGTYKIRRVMPAGYKLTTAPTNIIVAAGQIFSGVLIGTINA